MQGLFDGRDLRSRFNPPRALIDGALVVTLAGTVFLDQVVVWFHLVFLVTVVAAFCYDTRPFLLRALPSLAIVTTVVVWDDHGAPPAWLTSDDAEQSEPIGAVCGTAYAGVTMRDAGATPRHVEGWYRRILRRLSSVDPLVADSALAVVLAVPLLIDLARTDAPPTGSPFRAPDLLGYALVAMLVVPLALRRRRPMAVFTVILAAAVATASLGYHPTSYGFGLIVATYTVARWCGRPGSLVALAAAIGFSVFVKIRFIASGIDIALFEWPLDAAYFAGAWFLGDSIRTRAGQTAELQRTREALTQQAVEREQLRIARELHDSIGHSLSVMVLYAGAADRELDRAPERARELISTVVETGRGSLEEMDELVRALRREPRSTTSIADVDSLAAEFGDLGLAVEITRTGEPRPLPEPVERTAFRLAQEALTNTLKHANARTAETRLTYTSDGLTVTITDDGDGCTDAAAWAGERHGLVGMRERVLALGGEFRAGTPPDRSGFVVEAHLPDTAGDPA